MKNRGFVSSACHILTAHRVRFPDLCMGSPPPSSMHAATGIMMTRCMPMPPDEFVADRPFLFILQHTPTRLPAFIGLVKDPSQ